jgi:HPt (histidine-containing phosphotransfer) domain-containing protein
MSDSVPHAPDHYLEFDRALERIGDLPALHDLLDALQTTLTRDVPHIERLLADNNVFVANRTIHSLKGFLPIFCCDALCDELSAIELLSKTASAAEVAVAYASLSPKLLQLQIEIDGHTGL